MNAGTWLFCPRNLRCPTHPVRRYFLQRDEIHSRIQHIYGEKHQKRKASHRLADYCRIRDIFGRCRTIKMKGKNLSLLVSMFVCLTACSAVFGQTKTYSDPNLEYTFEVPDERWKVTARPSATNNSVEMVLSIVTTDILR